MFTSEEELKHILKVYAKKMYETRCVDTKKEADEFQERYEEFLNNSELRFYKAVPIKIYKLAPSKMYNGKYLDSRVEVELN